LGGETRRDLKKPQTSPTKVRSRRKLDLNEGKNTLGGEGGGVSSQHEFVEIEINTPQVLKGGQEKVLRGLLGSSGTLGGEGVGSPPVKCGVNSGSGRWLAYQQKKGRGVGRLCG